MPAFLVASVAASQPAIPPAAPELTCVNAAEDGVEEAADAAAELDAGAAADDEAGEDDEADAPADDDEADVPAAGAVAVDEEPHAANDKAVAVVSARTMDRWRRFDMRAPCCWGVTCAPEVGTGTGGQEQAGDGFPDFRRSNRSYRPIRAYGQLPTTFVIAGSGDAQPTVGRLCHHLSMAETGDAAEAIEHDVARGRFSLSVDEAEMVVLDYRVLPGAWDIVHTYADPAYRGTGAASRLVQHVFDQARSAGLKIIPSCPYIPVWVGRHPEAADLVGARP
jgi:predicted GNAT family acetyltransferase